MWSSRFPQKMWKNLKKILSQRPKPPAMAAASLPQGVRACDGAAVVLFPQNSVSHPDPLVGTRNPVAVVRGPVVYCTEESGSLKPL